MEQNCKSSTSAMAELLSLQGSGTDLPGKNHESLLYKLLPSLTLRFPLAIVVNNNVFLVNSSGICFQSVCYINVNWEPLSLESHNHAPSQLTENHVT